MTEQQQLEQQHHQRLAVLIPYRNREQHLRQLLAVLRPYLSAQRRDFDFFILEQARSNMLLSTACSSSSEGTLDPPSLALHCCQPAT